MSQITSTAGGSGSYTLGAATSSVTLFTTPNVTDAIFIVYLHKGGSSGPFVSSEKIIVGPNTPVKLSDSTSATGIVSFNWVQMIIS